MWSRLATRHLSTKTVRVAQRYTRAQQKLWQKVLQHQKLQDDKISRLELELKLLHQKADVKGGMYKGILHR
jgi:hypothetical protein